MPRTTARTSVPPAPPKLREPYGPHFIKTYAPADAYQVVCARAVEGKPEDMRKLFAKHPSDSRRLQMFGIAERLRQAGAALPSRPKRLLLAWALQLSEPQPVLQPKRSAAGAIAARR